jgi:selenocysteine lyase/cysteine desulfurase
MDDQRRTLVSSYTPITMPDLAHEFPVRNTHTYLNTAAQGPWPTRTAQAVQQVAARSQFLQPDRAQGEPTVIDEARGRLAALLGVTSADLAFGPNTTFGLNVCMNGIDWRTGDNLVVPDNEFPSVQFSLTVPHDRGVEIRRAQWQGSGPTVADIMARVDGRTRAVICSAISWDLGYRMDLEALGAACAKAGCLLIVDGIHAVGAEHMDVKHLRLSAMSVHGYKWLMAGFGVGALYVSPEAVSRIRPTFPGPQGVEGDLMVPKFPAVWKAGAARYSAGTGNVIGSTALNASLTLIEEVGVEAIRAHNHALAGEIAAGIARRLPNAKVWRSSNPAHQSAIVVFSTGNQTSDSALVEKLAAQNVIVALRPQGIRVSPHLFNTEADVRKLLDALM